MTEHLYSLTKCAHSPVKIRGLVLGRKCGGRGVTFNWSFDEEKGSAEYSEVLGECGEQNAVPNARV